MYFIRGSPDVLFERIENYFSMFIASRYFKYIHGYIVVPVPVRYDCMRRVIAYCMYAVAEIAMYELYYDDMMSARMMSWRYSSV